MQPTFYKIQAVYKSDKKGFKCLVLTKITKEESVSLKFFCEGKMSIKSLDEVLETEKTFESEIQSQYNNQTYFAHIRDHDYVLIIMNENIDQDDIKNRLVVDVKSFL